MDSMHGTGLNDPTGLFEVYRVHVTVYIMHVTCAFGKIMETQRAFGS